MSTLWYIIIRTIKNRLKEMVHKPAKLILYLFCIGTIGALVVASLFTENQGAKIDILWLKGIYFGFIMIFVILSVQRGLSNGDTIFEMQDVNLLFVSPISSKSILIYGLVQMAKTALLAGFFILFQSGTLSSFGKGFDAVLILWVSFMLATVLLSIVSLVIYNLTNGRPKRKRFARALIVLMFFPLLASFGIKFLQTGSLIAALEHALSSPVFSWTPVAGWNAQAAVSLMDGQMGTGMLFIGVMLVTGVLLIAYILLGNIDYYEDVLVATETAFEKRRAVSEGRSNSETFAGGKTKVVKTGISGRGASTFFYKHLRESIRANAFGLFTLPTIFMILGAAAFASYMRNHGGACLPILQLFMWMQVFLIGMERGLKELLTHYIYLIPEPSFYKILWSNLQPVAKVLLESIFIFGIAGAISRESIPVILGCIAVFTLFSMMLIAINYLFMRWFGTDMSSGILLILYLLIVLLVMMPGLIAAVLISVVLEGFGVAAGLGVFSVWLLLVSIVCFVLSKGVLHNCDIQVRSK